MGVDRGGPAEQIGLEQGDIISSFGRYYVTDLEDVGILLESVRPGERVEFGGLRLERDEFWRISGTLRARRANR
jgi:S1-C subfamily serine protease